MKVECYRFGELPFRLLNSYVFQKISDRKLTGVYHSHDFYELIWVLRGSATQVVDGKTLFMREGSVALLRPGEAHCFLSQAEDLSLVSLSVEEEEFFLVASVYMPTLPSHISRQNGHILFGASPLLGEVSGSTEFDCKYLLSFFLRAYMASEGPGEEREALPPVLGELAAKMREHENLRQGVAAALSCSHYSQCHLARLIRAQYGMGLKEWINDLRLEAAYRELLLTDKTVMAISLEVGFSSMSHFNKIFKSKFGTTPAAARRKGRVLTV